MQDDLHIGPQINMLSRRLKMRIGRNISAMGLTSEQSHLLHYLFMESQQHDMFQRDIERAFNVRRATATGMLKLLEKNGFITRESVAEDARLKKISLTEKAVRLDNSICAEIHASEELLRSGVSEAELNTFLDVMRRMNANLARDMDEPEAPPPPPFLHRKLGGRE